MTNSQKQTISLDIALRVMGTVILAIVAPILSWTTLQVINITERIATVEARERGNHELLIQIRADQKEQRKLLLELLNK